MYKAIYEEAQAMQEELTAWRHALHAMPELGLALPQTSAYVQARLDEMGVAYHTIIGGSGVVAQLGQGEPCLLLRADMDALPMSEQSGVDYAATNGCMHACGHDLHTTALLGAAKLLKRHEKELRGTIKFIFQPGEETFNGAKAVINEGVLENPHVDAAMGTHVATLAPVGVVGYGDVPNAAVYGFKMTITGKGTHGAMPQDGVDPINTGLHIYLALQELVARECAPNQEVSLTIGHFEAGSACNVIPETAIMEGTLRVFDEALRNMLIQRIHEVATHVAAAYRSKVDIEVLSDVPALICTPSMNAHLATVYKEMLPDLMLWPTIHTTGSEDFACYAQYVPTAFFFVGAQPDEADKVFAQHNPKIIFNDNALPLEAALYACAALAWPDYQV